MIVHLSRWLFAPTDTQGIREENPKVGQWWATVRDGGPPLLHLWMYGGESGLLALNTGHKVTCNQGKCDNYRRAGGQHLNYSVSSTTVTLWALERQDILGPRETKDTLRQDTLSTLWILENQTIILIYLILKIFFIRIFYIYFLDGLIQVYRGAYLIIS